MSSMIYAQGRRTPLSALAVIALGVAAAVRYSRLGYGFIAIREDEDTARMLGVPTERYKLVGFILSSILTGLIGAAYAFSLGYITTGSVFRPDLSFNMIVYALLGGMGTLLGPVVGATIMALLTQVVLGDFLQVHMMLTGLVIIALVFLLPDGLMGAFRRCPRPDRVKVAADLTAKPPLSSVAAHLRGDDDPPILRIKSLTKQFRGLRAIDGVDIAISRGSICTIIGPNGAGKSTIFNMVTGYLAPTTGEIWYEGGRIDGLRTHQLSRLGIARVFQIAKPFHGLSVYENVLVGALFGRDGARDPDNVATEALALTGLASLARGMASSLPVWSSSATGNRPCYCHPPTASLGGRALRGLESYRDTRNDLDPQRCAKQRHDRSPRRARYGNSDADIGLGLCRLGRKADSGRTSRRRGP